MTDTHTQSYELGYDDGWEAAEKRWRDAVVHLREFREKDSMVCQVLDRLMEIVEVQREG